MHIRPIFAAKKPPYHMPDTAPPAPPPMGPIEYQDTSEFREFIEKYSTPLSYYGYLMVTSDRKSYFPGQRVKGSIFLDVLHNLPGNSIYMTISGYEMVMNKNLKARRATEDKPEKKGEATNTNNILPLPVGTELGSSVTIPKVPGENLLGKWRNKFCDLEHKIFQFKREISKGQYHFPFTFFIPMNLPGSFDFTSPKDGLQISVTYKMKVHIPVKTKEGTVNVIKNSRYIPICEFMFTQSENILLTQPKEEVEAEKNKKKPPKTFQKRFMNSSTLSERSGNPNNPSKGQSNLFNQSLTKCNHYIFDKKSKAKKSHSPLSCGCFNSKSKIDVNSRIDRSYYYPSECINLSYSIDNSHNKNDVTVNVSMFQTITYRTCNGSINKIIIEVLSLPPNIVKKKEIRGKEEYKIELNRVFKNKVGQGVNPLIKYKNKYYGIAMAKEADLPLAMVNSGVLVEENSCNIRGNNNINQVPSGGSINSHGNPYQIGVTEASIENIPSETLIIPPNGRQEHENEYREQDGGFLNMKSLPQQAAIIVTNSTPPLSNTLQLPKQPKRSNINTPKSQVGRGLVDEGIRVTSFSSKSHNIQCGFHIGLSIRKNAMFSSNIEVVRLEFKIRKNMQMENDKFDFPAFFQPTPMPCAHLKLPEEG